MSIVTLCINACSWSIFLFRTAVYTPVGRQFYKPLSPAVSLGNGRVAHDGYFKSVRLVMGEPRGEPIVCLNVDGKFSFLLATTPLSPLFIPIIAKKAPFFKEQPLLETVKEILKTQHVPSSALTRDQVHLLSKHLKGKSGMIFCCIQKMYCCFFADVVVEAMHTQAKTTYPISFISERNAMEIK